MKVETAIKTKPNVSLSHRSIGLKEITTIEAAIIKVAIVFDFFEIAPLFSQSFKATPK